MAVYVRAPQEEVLAGLREKLERYIEINKGFRTVYLQFDFSRSISFFILFTHRLFIIEEQKKGKELWQSEKSES